MDLTRLDHRFEMMMCPYLDPIGRDFHARMYSKRNEIFVERSIHVVDRDD